MPSCVRASCGLPLPEVRHLVPRVRLLALADLCKCPWPSGGRGRWQWRSLGRLALFVALRQMLSLSSLYSVAVLGAAGHNRGEASSRQDTRQELGPWFTFKADAVCRVSFKPRGETSGLKGTVPRTGGHSSAHVALGACDRMCGPRGTAASGSRSVQHDWER